MNQYIPVETQGGTLWVEVETPVESEKLTLTAINFKEIKANAAKSLEDAVKVLKQNARFILDALSELNPQEVDVSCGIKVGVEGGVTFFGLAKAAGEANYTITMKWKPQDPAKKP